MANLIGGLTFVEAEVNTGDPGVFLQGIWDVAIAEVGGNRYLYATSYNEYAIEVFLLGDDGSMTPVGDIQHSYSSNPPILASATEISTVTVGANQYVVASTDSGHTTTFRINAAAGPDQGLLTTVSQLAGAPTAGTTHVTAQAGDNTYIVTLQSGTMTSHRLFSNGTTELRDTETDSASLPLAFAADLETFRFADVTYVTTGSRTYFGQGNTAEGMGLWRLNANGTLVHLETEVPPGPLGPLGIGPMEAVVIGGRQFVFAINQSNRAIATYEMTTAGDLTFLQELALPGNVGLDNVLQMSSFVVEGETFLMVSDTLQGMCVFGVTSDGVVNTNLMQGSVSGGLDGAFGAETFAVGGRIFALSNSYFASKINSIDIGGGNDVLGDTADSDRMFGLLGDDTLTADAGNDVLFGGGGDDVLAGGLDRDTLVGGSGNDELVGGVGNDMVLGGEGDDTLYGDAVDAVETSGQNTLEGGAGADFIQGTGALDFAGYAGSASGVAVHLQRNGASGGDAAGDTFLWVEGVIGSAFDDTITGDTEANWLIGGQGKDRLYGGAKGDTLQGGQGNDTMTGGAGKDFFVVDSSGGSKSDRINDFEVGRAGDRVDLTRSDFASFDEIKAAMFDKSNGAVLQLGPDSYLVFVDVFEADFKAGNFLL